MMENTFKIKDIFYYDADVKVDQTNYFDQIKADAMNKFKEKYSLSSLEDCKCYISAISFPVRRYNVTVYKY